MPCSALYPSASSLNSNIRCIEMSTFDSYIDGMVELNSNIRCIEIIINSPINERIKG